MSVRLARFDPFAGKHVLQTPGLQRRFRDGQQRAGVLSFVVCNVARKSASLPQIKAKSGTDS